MYWECLSSHGSELDPEGQSSPYQNAGSKFRKVRKQKRIVQGHPQKRDIETWDSDEEITKAGTNDNLVIAVYEEWQGLVSEYSSRELTQLTNKVPAFLGLCKMMEGRLQDRFIAGIWNGAHFLPSLLWNATKPGVTSRNPNFPSWTWASIIGKIQYRMISSRRVSWEPSDMVLDIKTPSLSQNLVTGSIRLKSTVRKFPPSFEFGSYSDDSGNGIFFRLLETRGS